MPKPCLQASPIREQEGPTRGRTEQPTDRVVQSGDPGFGSFTLNAAYTTGVSYLNPPPADNSPPGSG